MSNAGQVLSATGFVLGSFVYVGHEKVWEYFGEHDAPGRDLPLHARLLSALA